MFGQQGYLESPADYHQKRNHRTQTGAQRFVESTYQVPAVAAQEPHMTCGRAILFALYNSWDTRHAQSVLLHVPQRDASYVLPSRSAVKPIGRWAGGGGFISCRIAVRISTIARS